MDENEIEYIKTQAKFALKLLQQTQAENLQSSILSPISISTSLAIAFNGASRETAKQIADVIAHGKSQESINDYFSKVLKRLQSNDESKFTLKSVNRLYAAEKFKILQDFTDIVKNNYDGQFVVVDFEKNLEGTRKKINKFVESETNNLIKEMIPEGILRNNTRLITVNAMYFLGKWKLPFLQRRRYLTTENFYVSKKITKKIYMMESEDPQAKYRYESTKDYEVLGLEYEGDYTMFILLPKKRFGLLKMIEKLNGQILVKHAKNMKMTTCDIKMPKFDFNLSMDLKKVLKNVGIKDAFDENNANFSKLTDAERVFIYAALHQSYIKVDEQGTEMASCAAMASAPCSGRVLPQPEINFIADHPFLYFVADNFGNILFIGTVVDKFQDESELKPTSKSSNHSGPSAAKKRRVR